MASKAKSKSTKSKSKTSPKKNQKAAGRKAAVAPKDNEPLRLSSHSKGDPDTIVDGHHYAVGTTVTLVPASDVLDISGKVTAGAFGGENTVTTKIDELGRLKVSLTRGEWCGKGKVDEGTNYIQFTAK